MNEGALRLAVKPMTCSITEIAMNQSINQPIMSQPTWQMHTYIGPGKSVGLGSQKILPRYVSRRVTNPPASPTGGVFSWTGVYAVKGSEGVAVKYMRTQQGWLGWSGTVDTFGICTYRMLHSTLPRASCDRSWCWDPNQPTN